LRALGQVRERLDDRGEELALVDSHGDLADERGDVLGPRAALADALEDVEQLRVRRQSAFATTSAKTASSDVSSVP
jgi:hypothetical protein